MVGEGCRAGDNGRSKPTRWLVCFQAGWGEVVMSVAQCELGVVLRGRLRAEGFGEGRYGLRTSVTKMGGRQREARRASTGARLEGELAGGGMAVTGGQAQKQMRK